MADYLGALKTLYQPGAPAANPPSFGTFGAPGAPAVNPPSFGVPGANIGTAGGAAPGENLVFDLGTLTPDIAATSTATGGTTSTSGSTSTTGIDFNSPGAAGLLDQIREWTGRATGLARGAEGNINNFYRNMLSNALRPEAFQGTLNSLRSRNILDSSVASNALGTAASGISRSVGDQALGSYLKSVDLQMGVPGMLSQLAQALGTKTATADSTAETTTDLSTTTTDPLSVWQTIINSYL